MKFKYSALSAAIASSLVLGSGAVVAQEKGKLEEVVVTARKQAESIVDTPIAVSVMDAEFFDKSGFNTMADVVKFVPGFDYSPTNTTRANGSRIRGISTFSFSDGFESSVATVIDGVVMGREAQGFFDLYDIESVEVIKGPQGTLFGKNASAGVVNVRTKKPEYEFSGGADFMVGSYGERRLRGSVTGPIVDDVLAYRITGSTHVNDGLTKNELAGQDDVNNKDTWSLRAKFLFEPSDELSALLTLDTVEEDNACCIATYRRAGGPIGALPFALNTPVLQLQDALDQAGITAGEGNRSVAIFDDRINQESEANGVALEVNYNLGDAQLTSITAWRDWEIDEYNEADQLSLSDFNNRNGTAAESEQVSQELRLFGNINDSLSYVTGLFYFEEDVKADGKVYVEIALPFPPFYNSINSAVRTADTKSFAAFGEVTWDVSEKFSLIVGARYTDEEKEATYNRMASPLNPLIPVLGSAFGPDLAGEQTVDDTNVSGRIIGRYSITEDVNAYLTWSRGYKGAGIDVAESANANFLEEPGGLPVVDPEIPTLIELGFKGWFLDSTLSLNTAIFHQTVEDLQTISNDGVETRNLSIGEVSSQGIEADITYLPPVEGLTLSGSFSWLDTSYEEFSERPELEGESLAGVPEYAVSFIADYSFQLGDTGWDAFTRFESSWQDDKYSSTSRSEAVKIDAYTLINLRAGVTSPDDKYSATLSVENATDEDYAYFIGGSTYSLLDGATTSHYLGPDRIVRLTLGVKF